jgi:diguanylate cyclase (GGDEF)-like protein/PAS domain S-box-containing protein
MKTDLGTDINWRWAKGRNWRRGQLHALAPMLIAALVLVVGLSISYNLWRSAEAEKAREARVRFDANASLAVAAVERRMNEYQAQLHSMQSFFVADQSFSRGKFRRYFESFSGQTRLPGIKALHFTRYVTAREKIAFVASVRNDRTLGAQGFPDFAIHPDGDRPEYFVIEYIEPLTENRVALGLDAASQAVNRQAFLAARDFNQPTITPPFQLVQAAPGELGLVMRAAVYHYGQTLATLDERRSAFIGLVGISLDAGTMFQDVFAEPYLSGLHISVHDVMANPPSAQVHTPRQLIAQSQSDSSVAAADEPGLSSVAVIPAGTRLWEISISAGEEWRSTQASGQTPTTIFWSGLVISMLLSLLYLVLARSRTRAEQLALQMTHDLRQSEQQSRKTASVLQATLDNMSQGISVVDENLQMTALNNRFCEILDFPSAMLHTSASFESFVRYNVERGEYGPCETEAKVREMVERAKTMQAHRFKRTRANGLIVEVVGHPLPGGGFVTTYADITEQEHAQERLMLAASVFTHAKEGIMITNASGMIVEANDTFTQITGYSRDEVLGRNPAFLRSERQSPEYYAAMRHDLLTNGHWSGEIWDRRKNGEVYPAMLTLSVVGTGADRDQHYVALFSDITSLKEHQLQLEHMAHNDMLTGLPNRVLLADRLRQAIILSQRRSRSLAVLYLDLDGFKVINDSHGHDVGDLLLVALAQSMKSALRDGDTFARLGGDEFVAVLVDLESSQDYEIALARLLLAAAQQTQVGDVMLKLSASIGVTLYPQDCVDADQLLRHADQAMYHAKQAGGNRYHLFDVVQDAAVTSRNESVERIRRGLEQREFVLYYQPKVNIKTGEVVGAEALIRWQYPQSGLLLPGAFLPLIEDRAVSVQIGEWVIDAALSQMEVWQAQGMDMAVSVNVGARQLQQADFVDRLRALLGAHPSVHPSRLEIEILETSALQDMAQVSQVIEACTQIGVTFALDDFGTGYSSLNYLKRLPLNELKIDQSFVRDLLTSPNDAAIVRTVVALGQNLGLSVIAEGVETEGHPPS